MKLKKMVALTLAGVMAASLSACGGGGGSAAPETKAAEGGEAPAEGGADAAASDTSGADIVLQVALRIPLPSRLARAGKRRRRSLKRSPAARWRLRFIRIPSLGTSPL